MKNSVLLVGTGPGDPGLTIRALKAMKQADIVLYDRLVTKKILKLLGPKTLKVYVGGGRESADDRHERIYQLILKHCNKGRKVVRLQNGDPLLFGRGGAKESSMRLCPE